MAISGTGSLVFGRLFDRYGFGVLVVLTAVSALYAPLTFFGGFWLALIGAAIWGLSMGVHRINHSRRRHTDGPSQPARLRVRTIYRGLRLLVVSRELSNRLSI